MRRDTIAASGGAVVFSCSLGIASVAVPLLALRAGYSAAEVGVLIALSAVAQMAARLGMGAWMRRLPDWTFVLSAAVLLAVSNLMTALTTAVVPFALALLLQGVSRAFFWTGSQTHVVRGDRSAVGALAIVNLAAAVGLLIGPVVAGLVGARSLPTALAAAAVLAGLACVPALLLDRLPPFSPPVDRVPGRIWRRPGVDAGCWAGVSSGAWRGLLGSYVPVALEHARQSAPTIGVLVSVANLAQLAGSGVVGRLTGRGLVRAFTAGTLTAGLGTAAMGQVADAAVLAGVALAVSGLGAGALQTVGPAVATDAVHPEERGEAIAATGAFRAAALLVAPLGTAAVVTVAPVGLALALGGLLIVGPAAFTRSLAAHVRDRR
ncbi:MAG: MFS transporter [Nocardioidaceae bacterium]